MQTIPQMCERYLRTVYEFTYLILKNSLRSFSVFSSVFVSILFFFLFKQNTNTYLFASPAGSRIWSDRCSTVFQYRWQNTIARFLVRFFKTVYFIIIIIHLFSIGFSSSILICITFVCSLQKPLLLYLFAALSLPIYTDSDLLNANIFRCLCRYIKQRFQFINVLIWSFCVYGWKRWRKKPLKLKEPIARQTILLLLIP